MKNFIHRILLKLCNKYICRNAVDGGILISELCYVYLHTYDLTKRELFKSLKDSVDIIEKEVNEVYGEDD